MRLLLVDLDDCLIETGHLYEEAHTMFIEYLIGYTNDTSIERSEFAAYDAEQCRRHGHSAERMTNSMLAFAEQKRGRPLGPLARESIRGYGQYPFTCTCPVKPGAREFLQAFCNLGIDVVLVTAGDQTIQTRRIEDFPYRNRFNGARIVDKKTPELFRQILQDHGVQPHQAWMVGNSYFSDIVPARAAGIHTALLHSYTWAYDNEPQPDLTEVLVGTTLLDIRDQILEEEGL